MCRRNLYCEAIEKPTMSVYENTFHRKFEPFKITHIRECVRVRVHQNLWFDTTRSIINSRTLDTDRR